MSNLNRRGAMALISASLCLFLAALFYFADPPQSLTASAPAAVPAAAAPNRSPAQAGPDWRGGAAE